MRLHHVRQLPKQLKYSRMLHTKENTTVSFRKTAGPDEKSDKKETPAIVPRKLWTHLIPPMPLIVSTVYRHYAKGPPAKSWSLTFDLAVAIMADFLHRSSLKTVEELQALTAFKGMPFPSYMKHKKVKVPQDYRTQAGDHLDSLLTDDDNQKIGWDWQSDKQSATDLKGEWMWTADPKTPNDCVIYYLHGGAYYLGSVAMYRQFLSKLAKLSGAKVFGINYRLAPQHPFPAAVEDALAGYLYLIDPPKDTHNAIDPNKIIIAGDSAGGGLTLATLIAIRDRKLPRPAGAMTMSPWLDLTHSLPSILSNLSTDYLPPLGFKHAPSPAQEYKRLIKLETSDSPPQESTPATPNPSDEEQIDRIQFYADNKILKHPLVSPIYDTDHLRGLPPLLVQAGTAERLRDESIYAAISASNVMNSDCKSSFPATDLTLELYEDQPHVFQLIIPTRSSARALKQLSKFVRDTASSTQRDLPASSFKVSTISPKGHLQDTTRNVLDKYHNQQLKEWRERLQRSSLKARLQDVQAAVELLQAELEKVSGQQKKASNSPPKRGT